MLEVSHELKDVNTVLDTHLVSKSEPSTRNVGCSPSRPNEDPNQSLNSELNLDASIASVEEMIPDIPEDKDSTHHLNLNAPTNQLL